MKPRDVAFLCHRFAGLSAGALLLVIGLTGSALVFHESIDRSLYPQLYRPSARPAASLDRVLGAARSYHPDSAPVALQVSEGHVYSVRFETKVGHYLEVFVDPGDYRVRGARIWEESLTGILYRLHYQLFLGEAGNPITGVLAIVLAVLGVTGVVLWPGWKKLRAGVSVRWRARPRLLVFDLHKTVGLINAVFLVILGVTGSAFMFYEPFKAAVYALTATPHPPASRSLPQTGQVSLGVDALMAKASPAMVGAELNRVRLPTTPTGPVQVRADFPGEGAASRRLRIELDRYSGAILRVEDGRRPTVAEAILQWIGPLHFGNYGGLVTQVLYVLVGLAPGGLFLTGFWLWLKKLRRTRGAAESRQKLPV